MKAKAERKSLIQSVERALNMLETLRDSQAPMRATDIAKSVELGPTTANNILRTLFLRGYLGQDENGRYALGHQSYLLGLAADAWGKLRASAREPMRKLAEETGCVCLLGVESQGQLIAVNIATGKDPLQPDVKQLWRDSMHSAAAGKILIAGMDKTRFEQFKSGYQLKRFTDKTICSWKALEVELDSIRKSGVAYNKDENAFGVTSIGVPVKAKGGQLIAALIVSFSSYYMNGEYEERMIRCLRARALDIALNYGA